jgi:hypothetical protein
LAAVVTVAIVEGLSYLLAYRDTIRSIHILTADGKLLDIQRRELGEAELMASVGEESWSLQFRHAGVTSAIRGRAGLNALRCALALANQDGCTIQEAQAAAQLLSDASTPAEMITQVARQRDARRGEYDSQLADFNRDGRYSGMTRDSRGVVKEPVNTAALLNLPVQVRVALEMAVVAQTEHDARESSDGALAAAWATAELIASISEGLIPQPALEEQLNRLRGTVQ